VVTRSPCSLDVLIQPAPTWAFVTGSWLGDYGQTNVTKADGTNCFDPISTSTHVPKELGSAPMAFICGDFVVLAADNQCIDDYQAIHPPSLILVQIWSLMTSLPTISIEFNRTGHIIHLCGRGHAPSHEPHHVPPP
jgi:hypothetical protein